MHLIPSKKQWNNWSLPSKLTAIGAYLTLIPFAISIVSMAGNAVYDYLDQQYWIREKVLSNEVFRKYTGKSMIDNGLNIEVVYPQIKPLFVKSIFLHANKEITDSIVSNLKPDLVELTSKYSITMRSDRILSIIFESYSYYQSAFNGDGSFGSINIDLRSNQFIDFFDVFDLRKGPVEEIKKLLRKKLDDDCVLDDRLESEKYIPRFALTEREITFLFSEYEVTIGACGHFTIRIPYEEVAGYIRKDGPVGDKFKAITNWDGREHKKKGVGIYY
jgi:hypothetical protein